MRILIIKTSSLGDIIHTFPALTDAVNAIPGIQFDWLVEEGFTELPALHPAVRQVIALPWRRLRKQLWHWQTWQELRGFVHQLQSEHYDLVIDAQGLIKSAFWTQFIHQTPIAGLSKESAREPLAAHWYDHTYPVAWQQHAIDRVRLLFSQALGYHAPDLSQVAYGLTLPVRSMTPLESPVTQPYWVFAHATTWESKHWPEAYWHQLIQFAAQQQRRVLIPWHADEELARAQRFARLTQHVHILPKCTLTEMAHILQAAELVVGVDTGLTHLAAAMHAPVIALYGATEPGLTGVVGPYASVLQAHYPCAPCFKEVCIELTTEDPINPPCYVNDLSVNTVTACILDKLTCTNH